MNQNKPNTNQQPGQQDKDKNRNAPGQSDKDRKGSHGSPQNDKGDKSGGKPA
jgi:hypothetical protein